MSILFLKSCYYYFQQNENNNRTIVFLLHVQKSTASHIQCLQDQLCFTVTSQRVALRRHSVVIFSIDFDVTFVQ